MNPLSLEKRIQDLSIIIPAAGMGERLGLGPKALLELNGAPLLIWVTRKALQITDDVILSAPPDYIEHFQNLCPKCRVIAGGDTRQNSVQQLVEHSNRNYVLLQDVARPFASLSLFLAVIEQAKILGCAGAFLNSDTPLAVIKSNIVEKSFEACDVGIFQAPQAFYREDLIAVLKLAEQHHWQEQSTLQLMLRANKRVGAVAGEKYNLKITTQEDWYIAQFLIGHL